MPIRDLGCTVKEKIGFMGLVPVVTFENLEEVQPSVQAIVEGGLSILEITLRTKLGLLAIKKIKRSYPNMLLGAGTILTEEQAKAAIDVGAEFIVSPGFNDDVVSWCLKNNILVTPGCVTPTEIEHALSFGLSILKFFPASVYGGAEGCKSLYAPYRMVKFIPTGGISLASLHEYSDKSFIHAIGGGWLCDANDIKNKKYKNISKVIRDSIDILLGFRIGDLVKDDISEIETNNIYRALYYLEQKGYMKVEMKDEIYLEKQDSDKRIKLIKK